jgi:hypothetical protein
MLSQYRMGKNLRATVNGFGWRTNDQQKLRTQHQNMFKADRSHAIACHAPEILRASAVDNIV